MPFRTKNAGRKTGGDVPGSKRMAGEIGMGSEVIARCGCGVEASILIGSGFDKPRPCYFPCLCQRCHAVVEVDLLDGRMRCPQCKSAKVIPYDDLSLSDGFGGSAVAEWNNVQELGRDLKLTDGNYRCPRCSEMTLHFTDSDMCWD